MAELAIILPFPWKERHPNVADAGAPEGRVPIEVLGRLTEPREIVLSRAGNEWVRLPERWHRLAVVGKTGTGKSTLVRCIVVQILRKEPNAQVVILELTGSLSEDIVKRMPAEVATDTIEIDPSRATFEEGGIDQVAVPLNLLDRPDRATMDVPARERRAEKLVGDLVQSIKNAWGEESIGGRADFVLRSFVQALLPLAGSNLVDVHAALTEKAALTRLERLSGGMDGHPLPRLSNEITISTVD
ncbi:MAG: ATP-binding protein [Thermoplasmata archaeon]|nr:ATP-binding protein [Thermoplasmata archaeon]